MTPDVPSPLLTACPSPARVPRVPRRESSVYSDEDELRLVVASERKQACVWGASQDSTLRIYATGKSAGGRGWKVPAH